MSSCPPGSTHCVVIATREWAGGRATPSCLGLEIQAQRGQSQTRCPAGQAQSGDSALDRSRQGLNMPTVAHILMKRGWPSAQGQVGHRDSGFAEPQGPFPASPGSPISFQDLPLVTKMCYNGCPDVPSLGLGPHVSIACCQSNLCNHD